jgi:hypothetical protein
MIKTQLRKLFWFILYFFEKGDEPYQYKALNRKILIFVGVLFILLSSLSAYFSIKMQDYGYLLPVVVFFSIGFVCIIVGALGSNKAIAKIWGNH